MRKGIPIETLVKLILGNGFLTGKWTVDLQLLLIEPTAYLLMWLADNVDIEPVLEVDGDEDMYAEEKLLDQASIAMSEMSAKPRPTMVELESQVSPSLLSDMSTFKNKG